MVSSILSPQLAVYTAYIPGIYCLLGDYINPTTNYQNQNKSMTYIDDLPWVFGPAVFLGLLCVPKNPTF